MLDDLCHSTETSDVIETLFNEELGSVQSLVPIPFAYPSVQDLY